MRTITKSLLFLVCMIISSYSFTIVPKVLDVTHYSGVDSSFGWALFQFDYRQYAIRHIRFEGNFSPFLSPEFDYSREDPVITPVLWKYRERDIHDVYSVDTVELRYKVAGDEDFEILVTYSKWDDPSYLDSVRLSVRVKPETAVSYTQNAKPPTRSRRTYTLSVLGRVYTKPSATNVIVSSNKSVQFHTW